MIHEVGLPRETKVYLWQIVHLQLDALSCAVDLFPGFTQEDLRTALATKMSLARAERVAEWIYGHKKPRETLQQFTQGSQEDRQTLTDSMRQDILGLYWGCRDKTLECRFENDQQLSDYQKGAKGFLIAFYEQLGSGIDITLFVLNPQDYRKYGRNQFFTAYERANSIQYACAICDEHRPITILRGEYFSDIEHYFPKSVYPHLACHPHNLIPLCKACNQAHLDRDPLAGQAGARRTLGEIFIPYRSESLRLLGVIKFDWRQPQSPALSVEERQIKPDSGFQAKLQAFTEIYNIPARWQDRIHQIGEQLWRQMSYYARSEMDKGKPLDVFTLQIALKRLLNYFIEDLGATPWDYVLIWYLSHLLVIEVEEAIQNNKQPDEIALLRTLQDLIKNQPSVNIPRLRADEILEASRKMYIETE